MLERIGYLFYLVDPRKHMFATIEEVPDYVVQVFPFFISLFLIEQCILVYQKKPTARVNDGISSVSQGLSEELSKIFFRSWTVVAYIYIYNNWRIANLPWDSLWTWVIAFILVDFGYYWAHRASHEINFLWAAHQVHHSSEEYNLTTALRQSVFQGYFLSVFYLPMAFFAPPSAYLVHTELNLLYQFWIHTEVIKSLGPLEYIFNTASHHRVHHGRNRYCIDKNYAGVLIIWDRIFGTFEPEDEKVVYGLTHPLNTFEPIYTQLCHFIHIFKTVWEIKGLRNKLYTIIKGPGWYPGMPWHGSIEDVPDVKSPVEKYDPVIPLWCKVYLICHFLILTLGYLALSKLHHSLPANFVYSMVLFEVLSLSTLGMLNEGRIYAPWLELVRCIVFFIVDLFVFPITELAQLTPLLNFLSVTFVRVMYGISLLGWVKGLIMSIRVKLHAARKKEKNL